MNNEEFLATMRFENHTKELRAMTAEEVGGFRRMLKRLRKELNKAEYFEELLGRGIKCFNVRKAWPVFSEEGAFSHVAFRWDRTKEYEPLCTVEPTDVRRRGLETLRGALNDKVRFDQLARIGPYALVLSFWQAEETSGEFFWSQVRFQLQNHAGSHLLPNTHWSLDGQTGAIYYHH